MNKLTTISYVAFINKITNEKITNEELCQPADQETAEITLKSSAWKWIGRTLSKPEVNMAKTPSIGNPQGNRKSGRPVQT